MGKLVEFICSIVSISSDSGWTSCDTHRLARAKAKIYGALITSGHKSVLSRCYMNFRWF